MEISLKTVFLYSILLLFIPALIWVQQDTGESTENREINHELRSVVQKYVDRGEFEGAVLVGQGEDTLMAEGWGLANREWGSPNTATTRYRIGSVTKTFTAVIIMRLVQDGLLDLEDLLDKYFSDLPAPVGSEIKVRHLLSHSSGMQEFYRVPDFNRLWFYNPPPYEELVQLVADHPLEFSPGSQYAYRNIGFIALGAIIEKVTGTSYESALNKYVLKPAGMKHSGLEQDREIIPEMAGGYARNGNGWQKGQYLNADIFFSAGGIYSSAIDLFRFSRALDNHLLLDREMQQNMFTSQIKESNAPESHRFYARGWHNDRLTFSESSALVDIIEHGGDVTSFETQFTRIPELNAVVIILHNHGEMDQNSIRDDLIRVLLLQTSE